MVSFALLRELLLRVWRLNGHTAAARRDHRDDCEEQPREERSDTESFTVGPTTAPR